MATSPLPATHQSATDLPSMDCPTEEYLHSFTRVQLQKYGRNIGLSNVWVKKGQLVDMIMNEVQTKDPTPQDNVSPSENIQEPTDSNTVSEAHKMSSEIQKIWEVLNAKDTELEQCKQQIEKLNLSVETLSGRVATLEATVSGSCDTETPPVTPHHSGNTEAVVKTLCDRVSVLEDKINITQETRATAAELPRDEEYLQLERRVSSLEKNVATPQQRAGDPGETAAHGVQQGVQPPSRDSPESTCLVLGDINLRYVRVADLAKTCKIRTLPEANFDLMRCWVKEQLSWAPAKCFIYCGLSDLLEETDNTTTLDNIGALLSELKYKNENMDVYISQLVPSLQSDTVQAKINEFNDHITKWGEDNGISIITLEPVFRLQTGDIDEVCYQAHGQHQGSLLNRLGAVRLLTAMAKQCPPLHEQVNWDNIRKTHLTPSTYGKRGGHSQELQAYSPPPPPPHGMDSDGWRLVTNRRRRRSHDSAPPYDDRRWPGHLPPDRRTLGPAPPPDSPYAGHRRSGRHPYPHPHPHRWGGSERSDRTYTPPPADRTDSRSAEDAATQGNSGYIYYRHGKSGCYKCGEFNHHQNTCRYDHIVKCNMCHSLGHKSRLCQYYSV